MGRYIGFLTVLMVLVSSFSCTPKITVIIEESEKAENNDIDVVNTNSPCATFGDLSPDDREQAENNYIFYKDLLKMKKYEDSYKHWIIAYTLAPSSNGRIKYQFDDGVAIYKEFYKNAETKEEKIAFMDSVMVVYDKRVECFGEDAYVAGRKAFDMYYYFKEFSDTDTMLSLFKKHMDVKGAQADYFVINPFTKLLVDGIADSTITIKEGQKYANLLLKAVAYGVDNCVKDCDAWKVVASYAPDRLESLEAIDGFYDCAYNMDKYYPLFLENPEDCETINMVYSRMLRGNCDPNDEHLIAVKAAKDLLCKKQVAEGPLRLGFDAYQSGKYSSAVKHFKDFIAATEDNEKKIKYNMVIAKIYYRDLKNYPKSRQFARAALAINPNLGEAYILIGKLYASSGPICGPGTGWDSQIVTWPAIDKWVKAKKVDSSVATEASNLISTYQKYMPSNEDVFFRPEINENDPFYVGCWIKEKTTVRTAK